MNILFKVQKLNFYFFLFKSPSSISNSSGILFEFEKVTLPTPRWSHRQSCLFCWIAEWMDATS